MEKNNRSNILAFLRQPYPLHPNRWMAFVLVPLIAFALMKGHSLLDGLSSITRRMFARNVCGASA